LPNHLEDKRYFKSFKRPSKFKN